MKKSIVWFILFLLAVVYGNAVTISSVTVEEPDNFYSSYAGNNIINLVVTVSNYVPENTVTVKADLSNLGNLICSGAESNEITLVKSAGDTWKGTCDVTAKAATTEFRSGKVIVTATESNGGTTDVKDGLILSLYNIGIPAGNSCYRFADGSTNFAGVTNFHNINIVLIVQAYGSASCVPNGMAWGDWMTVGRLTFTNVDLTNPVQANKLLNLSNIVRLQFSPPKTNQNSRVIVDMSQMPELDRTSVFELYHLPFISPGVILSDNSNIPPVMNWTSNGFDDRLNMTTFNLGFTVTPGFLGYTITENVAPKITLTSPAAEQSFDTAAVTFSAVINGTGTGMSKVFFSANGNPIAAYNGSVNTANCTETSNPEIYACHFTTTQSDGNYNLTVTAYDYGKDSGNIAAANLQYVVQTGGPVITLVSPKNGSVYKDNTGSMLKLIFNATDGNGIRECSYELSGPENIDDTDVAAVGCSQNVLVQMYLSTGTYELTVHAEDTLREDSELTVSFSVEDDVPPVLNDTTKFTGNKKVVLSVNTDESATCKYDVVDASYNKMKSLFTNNVTVHTAELELDKDNNYIYYVRCEDLSDNSNSASLKIPIIYDSSKLNESVTETVSEEYPLEKYDLGFLPAGMRVINIDNGNLPVTDILLTTIGVANNVELTVEVPRTPSTTYTGKVYKYISVRHDALYDDVISDVKIKFRVAKSWLTQNSLNRSDVYLLRFQGDWKSLNTTMTKEEGDYIYYVSDSPGLSLFAISTKAVVQNNVTETQPSVDAQNLTSDTTSESAPTQKKGRTWIWILVGIIVFVIVALFILVEKNEGNSPPPIFPSERTFMGKIRRLFK